MESSPVMQAIEYCKTLGMRELTIGDFRSISFLRKLGESREIINYPQMRKASSYLDFDALNYFLHHSIFHVLEQLIRVNYPEAALEYLALDSNYLLTRGQHIEIPVCESLLQKSLELLAKKCSQKRVKTLKKRLNISEMV